LFMYSVDELMQFFTYSHKKFSLKAVLKNYGRINTENEGHN